MMRAGISHSAAVAFTALPSQTFDFTVGISPATASEPAGQPAIFSLDVSPTTGSFPNNVSFSCSKLPALTTCGFNPSQVGSGSQNSAVTFTLTQPRRSLPPELRFSQSHFLYCPCQDYFCCSDEGCEVKSCGADSHSWRSFLPSRLSPVAAACKAMVAAEAAAPALLPELTSFR